VLLASLAMTAPRDSPKELAISVLAKSAAKKFMQHSCNTSITRRGVRGSVLGFWAFAGQPFRTGRGGRYLSLGGSSGVKQLNNATPILEMSVKSATAGFQGMGEQCRCVPISSNGAGR
jgi:hypothetical protein